MPKRTEKITYDLKDRGYKLNGTSRDNIDVRSLVAMINSPEVQELVKNGAMQGFYGHQIRQLFGMRPPETAIVAGKTIRLEPACKTVFLSATPEGILTHQQEFFDNEAGQKAYKQYKAGIGGFSTAVDYFKGTLPKIAAAFFGLDYVWVPNYVGNTGHGALEAAFDSLNTEDPDPLALAYKQDLEAAVVHIYDSLQTESELNHAYLRIEELELDAQASRQRRIEQHKRQQERQESVFDSLLYATVPYDPNAANAFLSAVVPILDNGQSEATQPVEPSRRPLARLMKRLGR